MRTNKIKKKIETIHRKQNSLHDTFKGKSRKTTYKITDGSYDQSTLQKKTTAIANMLAVWHPKTKISSKLLDQGAPRQINKTNLENKASSPIKNQSLFKATVAKE